MTTQWSLILRAARPGSPESARALASLCANYWYPLYAFVRRQGHGAHDAQDLTQEFFARLIAKNTIAGVAREKGRFRSFLLAAMKNFLANEWDKARARKRGGDCPHVPFAPGDAETRYAGEPANLRSADRIFERRWALTILDRVLDRLRAEHLAAGKSATFDALKGCLTDGRSAASYSEIAARLRSTEGAIKVAVHRLRRRYRELLRAEVSETVGSAEDVDDELRHLLQALAD